MPNSFEDENQQPISQQSDSKADLGRENLPQDADGAYNKNNITKPKALSGYMQHTSMSQRWLDDLNAEQRLAAETIDGPLLVLAGAGTGKTRVLTTRMANILAERKARPYEMLVVTFTNKAAHEMKMRATDMVGLATEGVWLGTFHALATRILRRHAEMVGLTANFTILDTDDQVRLLKQILATENIDDKRWPARSLIHILQRWKDKGWSPTRVNSSEAGDIANGRAVEIYAQYQERLKIINAADFGDLLLHNLTLFDQNPDILAKYQQLFRYILVDEYQDTNIAQYLWLRLLAQGHKNLCCVGDDDQSIYGWRGAEVGNILKFERDFPGAKTIRLERNYRSSGHILGAASGIIDHNQGRLGKKLWTEDAPGETVKIHGLWDGMAEARQIGDLIEERQRAGDSLATMAILVRAGFQTREFEERLITLGIPYKVIGGARFYEREEIRDAIAYLRVIRSPSDDLALERILNKPARGIGKITLQAIHRLARQFECSLNMAARKLLDSDECKPAVHKKLYGILEDFVRWRTLASQVDHIELTETVLEESGYTDFWKTSKKPEAPGKLDNLKELIVALDSFENLAEFLEHVSLVMENEDLSAQGVPMVAIMTLHGAKGLEFDTVFLPGWEEGLFPSQRSMDEKGLAGLEEERRLAYVGLTRAKKRAFILFAANRRIHGQWQSALPARFIEELPAEHSEIFADRGLYGGSGGGVAEAREQFLYGHQRRTGYGDFGATDVIDVPVSEEIDINQALAEKRERQAKGGPGYQRMQRHGAPYQTMAVAKRARILTRQTQNFQQDERCFHQKFGPGTVVVVDGDHLTIEFDKAGRKKVVAAYVEKAGT